MAQEKEQKRKDDTREKIMLGGLVIKAGLQDQPSNVLLGLLCEAKEQLDGPDKTFVKRRYERRGKEEFEKGQK